jgi:PIN domain nuclease of toxin-antitoxin system
MSHALQVYNLPLHHADPFDRLLVAQSQLESLPLVTKDENIQRYELETIW